MVCFLPARDGLNLSPSLLTQIDRRKLTSFEKTDYINAVKCLQRNPSKAANPRYPGAVKRMDDFVLTHILATLDIHNTVSMDLDVILSFPGSLFDRFQRPNFSPGIAISSIYTKSCFARNVAIVDISRELFSA